MTAIRYVLPIAALLLVAHCSPRSNERALGGDQEVRVAAEIAIGIKAFPDKADSTLQAHAVTADQYELMLYHIAADSTKSAAYREIVGG